MEIHEAMSICFKNDIKVYPVIESKQSLRIEINYKGKKKKGNQIFNVYSEQKQLQKKMAELYFTLAKKIQGQQ
jgi:hypothetical protein